MLHSLPSGFLSSSRRLIGVAVLVPCLWALSVPLPLSAAPTPTEAAQKAIQKAIQSVFDDQDTALMAHDIDGVMVPYSEDTLFLNDLKGTEHTGLASERQAWLDLMNLKTQKMTLTNHQIKEITVNKTKQGATVLAVHHMTLAGTTKTGIPYETGVDETLRYFWAKTADGWRIKQERILSVDTFLNGKQIRHNHKPLP